jgi:hypothetical protein
VRCGANFRKPVSEISDRAKRYRAHSAGCRPKGPKVCFKCGSRRFVVPDHIDGDESNGRRSNLRWACKSHNTILGKKMAKAGKGVRTRQYNPTDKIAGHEGWKQLMASKLANKYDGLRRSGMSHDEAVRETLRSTTAGPGSIALFKTLVKNPKVCKRNPGAGNLAQYVQAAVDHTRGAHDAGGKVIHETPKPKRREFAREIAFRKGYRSNPDEGTQADALYRKFHGRGPDRITNLLVRGIDPYGDHPALTSLGPLIRLVVGEGVELNKDGTIADEGEFVNEITFVPMAEYRRATETVDPKNPAEVRELKCWLKAAGAPDVAAVPNTRQLYFVGGKQSLDDAALRALGCDPEKDLCDLGDCFLIEYFAQKRFDQFEPMTYYHALGEITHVQPRLIYRRPQKMLELVGGEYVVKAAGIDN